MRVETIGNCTLILGDCREVIASLTAGFDAVVTDPPYGISDAVLKLGKGRGGSRRGGDNEWHPESDWDKSLDPAWGPMVAQTSEVIAWFGQWRKREEVAGFIPYPLRAEVVWAKDCHMGPPSPVAPRDERIWLFAKNGIKGKTFETSVWDEPIIPTWEHKFHKNEKPVPLMRRLIAFLGPKTVLDPFMGSGTTGVACAKMGLTFTGIEQDEGHFETACQRIQKAYQQPDLFVVQPKPEQFSML